MKKEMLDAGCRIITNYELCGSQCNLNEPLCNDIYQLEQWVWSVTDKSEV